MGALQEEERRFTYADYKEWDLAEGKRYELIRGEAFAMSAPSDFHQSISGEIFKQIAVYLTGKSCKVRAAPYNVRLFYAGDESDDTVVQPDISIICDREKRGDEGCRGAPDMVVEILSPSNTAREMDRKFGLYQKAGVREYWVVNPEDKTLQTFLFEGKVIHFRSCAEKDKADVGIFPGFAVDLAPVFAEDV